ncbi:acyl-CoA binding protein [Anaeromyces robustus]|uniref:Acyl-CoA binding protein n=1 Tax=Anaeromyces robustus TaxID=1754192 RepID=A0A1Y1X5G8_9FUNG|nr:acyl-CoA binding protein [Anaeromyces robustus]|eukprot:ORX80898.1 acyl-CoA binding protein [Anaeromyces robustus]
MLSETDKKFAEAVHIFQNLPQELRPTQEEELEFYGLYKRAVVGQCDIPKPDFFNILALAKWEAWKKLDSLSMLKAREIYVDQLIKLLERFPDRPDVVELLDTFTKLHLNDNDDTISNKSQAKSNTLRSNGSDSINNDFQIGNVDNQQIEFTTTREINNNNNSNQANSINMNNSMNSSINLGSPGLSRNNSSQSTTEEFIINSNLL